MDVVRLIARRATCPRKDVGCLIVKNNKIIASGYNGAPKGMEHCTEAGCLIKDNHCTRIIHAEANALLQAGRDAEGATLYCTCLPCEICFKLCIQAGINRVVYDEDYNKQDLVYWINNGGIIVTQYHNKNTGGKNGRRSSSKEKNKSTSKSKDRENR
jgi:dCMP deaminase